MYNVFITFLREKIQNVAYSMNKYRFKTKQLGKVNAKGEIFFYELPLKIISHYSINNTTCTKILKKEKTYT